MNEVLCNKGRSKHEKADNKNFYVIYHCYDVDGGFGDAVSQRKAVGVVFAAPDEVLAYLEKWDNPEVYDSPYADLYHHSVQADKIEIADLATLKPY